MDRDPPTQVHWEQCSLIEAIPGEERGQEMKEHEECIVNVNQIPWTAGKTGLRRKPLVDFPTGPKARIVRMEPGEIVPRHKHPSNEIMYILEGELELHGQVLGPGTCYYKPKDWLYGPLTTKTGVSVLLFFDGPDRFEV